MRINKWNCVVFVMPMNLVTMRREEGEMNEMQIGLDERA